MNNVEIQPTWNWTPEKGILQKSGRPHWPVMNFSMTMMIFYQTMTIFQ